MPGLEGLDAPVWPVLDGEEPGVWPADDDDDGDDGDGDGEVAVDEGDDAEEVPSPAPAAEVPDPPELREAHPASEANTTAVVATVFTRGFIVLHLL